MSVRLTDDGDVRLAEHYRDNDPFQLAPPSWLVHPQLPHLDLPRPTPEQLERERTRQREREQQIIKENQLMAIKLVEERLTPSRLNQRGTISSSQEFSDVLAALRDRKDGQSIVVTIESPELLKKDKAEVSFAYAIRRYLAKNNIAATAYQSGKHEVVVRKSAMGAGVKTGGKKK